MLSGVRDDGKRLLQPARDRPVHEGAPRRAVAGIVEPHAAGAEFGGKAREFGGLRAGHVRTVAAEPDEMRMGVALALGEKTHGDLALVAACADGYAAARFAGLLWGHEILLNCRWRPRALPRQP